MINGYKFQPKGMFLTSFAVWAHPKSIYSTHVYLELAVRNMQYITRFGMKLPLFIL